MLREVAVAAVMALAVLTGFLAVFTPTASAQCPGGCVQRGSYCDCPSNEANVSSSCNEQFQCDYGFRCVIPEGETEGTCTTAGGEERVAAPEGDFLLVALIFAMAGLLFLLRK